MVLNDKEIRAWADNLGVEPYDPALVNPASIDLTLSNVIIEVGLGSIIDASNHGQNAYKMTTLRRLVLQHGQKYILQPGTFILASSMEVVHLPHHLAGDVKLKSTTAREGIGHVYAGWIDPGFRGQITFELFSHVPVVLVPGRRICQMVLHVLSAPAERPYNGRYQYQVEPTPAKPDAPLIQAPIVDEPEEAMHAMEEEPEERITHSPLWRDWSDDNA